MCGVCSIPVKPDNVYCFLLSGQQRKVPVRIDSHIHPFAKGDMAMDLDLETFLVTLYVIVDALYQSDIQPRMPTCGGHRHR